MLASSHNFAIASWMKICPECKTEYPGGEVFCPGDGARLLALAEVPLEKGGDPLVGRSFDRYEVVRRIGEGGMGLVYEAVHTGIGKRVALKVLRDDYTQRPEVVERFQREAKSASLIGHEHIVDVTDFGVTPTGASYFVMEYLEGEDLATRLERERTLRPAEVVKILLQCCAALGAAHDKGIVHRDVKPENIFLTRRGEDGDFVKIVDFGIAKMSALDGAGEPGRKLTKTGMIFGTPEYMSPEQAAGKPLDHRVDVYALGVILFECLTGRVPFVGDSFMGILTKHLTEEVPRLADVNPDVDCPPPLEAVMLRAMMKDPAARYASMAEMAEDLRAALGGRVAPETRETFERLRESASAKSRRVAWAALFALAAAGVTGAGLATLDAEDGREAALVEQATSSLAAVEAPPAEPGPSPEAPALPPRVWVRVETVPAGAEASVEGAGLACGPTPCEIEVDAGEAITIAAVRGRASGKAVVTPEGRSTVQILLTEPKRVRPASEKASPAALPKSGRDDLKIPDIFR